MWVSGFFSGVAVVFFGFFVLSYSDVVYVFDEDGLAKILTVGYKEGQVDALNKDIRWDNKLNCWKKSPWDDGTDSFAFNLCAD